MTTTTEVVLECRIESGHVGIYDSKGLGIMWFPKEKQGSCVDYMEQKVRAVRKGGQSVRVKVGTRHILITDDKEGSYKDLRTVLSEEMRG